MKNKKIAVVRYINSTVFITIVMVTVFFNYGYAQDPSTSDIIVGTWTFSESSSIAKMKSGLQQDLATSSHLQQHVSMYYTGRQLNFTTGGLFSIILGTGQRLDGQWSIQNDVLTMLDTNGYSTIYQIGSLDNNSLLLLIPTHNVPGDGTLFPEMYFIKN